MNYNKIRKMDISNGEGVRIALFVQGCSFHCKNCFNQETWDFAGGKPYTEDTTKRILELCSLEYIAGLSILGGEPLHPTNIETVTKLAFEFKKTFPNKTLWVWTGFNYDSIKGKEIFNYIDVLVDGQYVDELHNYALKWRGSANQRVIDMKKTLASNEVVLYCD